MTRSCPLAWWFGLAALACLAWAGGAWAQNCYFDCRQILAVDIDDGDDDNCQAWSELHCHLHDVWALNAQAGLCDGNLGPIQQYTCDNGCTRDCNEAHSHPYAMNPPPGYTMPPPMGCTPVQELGRRICGPS